MGQNFQDDFGKSIFMEHVVAVVEDSSTGKEIIVKPSESSDGGYEPDMELLDFDGSFKDGYKASVTVSQTGKTYDIDLSERKDVYEGYEYKDNKLQRELIFTCRKPLITQKSGAFCMCRLF